MLIIKQLGALILNSPRRSATKLIAIDGRGGSGKSSLAAVLKSFDPTLQIVHLDSFPATSQENPFHPLGTQTKISSTRILESLLIPLSKGLAARVVPTPWWINQSFSMEETIISPGGTVLVEGCYALLPELRDYFDFKIWIDCPASIALERALGRDGGESDRRVWKEVYVPGESRYIEECKPQLVADFVVDGST